ncbi:MAG: protein-disulfide reductase DsbD family protein [Opitutales bacterium]
MVKQFSSFCAGAFLGAGLLASAPVEAEHATLELIAETEQVVPGEPLQLAVHFDLEPHWHIYWKNPGASGLPPEFTWDLPEGWAAGEPQFPAPERLDLDGLVSYAYEEAATFIVPVETTEGLAVGEKVRIGVDVFYLICEDVCLPGEASLSLELEVGDSVEPGPDADRFAAARAEQPDEGTPWQLSPSISDETMHLRIEGPDLPGSFYFFAWETGFVDPNAPQPYVVEDGVGQLEIQLEHAYFEADGPVIPGILQSGEGSWAVRLGQAAGEVSGTDVAERVVTQSGGGGVEQMLIDSGIGGWLLLAFLGGLILNIMPCVLPVLSLKVFSLLNHSGQSRGRALAHGLAYSLGVVVSFLVLAGVLFGLRALGDSIGWGFQLQNPGFVLVLALVFFVFGLNLLGVFEIGTGLVGADQKVAGRKDLYGSFGVGVLAAVVGAPCVGPLVGGVGGVALQAETATGILIFGMMGFGMASPFLLLAAFPKLVGYLPKPGNWMVTFKQSMGFLLIASVVFLVYVMGTLAGLDAVTITLIVLFLAGLASWIYGVWGAPHRSKRSKGVGRSLSFVLIALALGYGLPAVQGAQAPIAPATDAADPESWQPWSREAVERSLAGGQPVFIDFTASWCLICQVNKKTALRTAATTELFEAYGVATYVADWTRYDEAITKELERFDRSGVPLYLLYSPGGEVRVLPQNLTSGTIRQAVEEVL